MTHRHALALDSMFITWLYYSSHAAKESSVSTQPKDHNMPAYDILSMTPSMPLIVNSKPTRASFREIFLHEMHHGKCKNMSRHPNVKDGHLLCIRSLPWRTNSGCDFSCMTNWMSWNEPRVHMLHKTLCCWEVVEHGRSHQ